MFHHDLKKRSATVQNMDLDNTKLPHGVEKILKPTTHLKWESRIEKKIGRLVGGIRLSTISNLKNSHFEADAIKLFSQDKLERLSLLPLYDDCN